MNKFYKLLFIAVMFCATNLMFAQRYTISGIVKDASTGEKLVGANVLITALGTGAATNTEGAYKIENVKSGTFEVSISYIGYLNKSVNLKVSEDVKVDFALEPSSVLLSETVVKSTKAVLRQTPVAFSEVKAADVEAKIGSQDLPMVLNTTPSIYASQLGGGIGDASVTMRGFDQKNIAVMINGVPVNDMEGKSVYWSNWAGISDVVEEIQVQRGLGASPYSVNAVGGIMNIRTAGVGSQEEYVKVKSEVGSNGLRKYSLGLHTKIANDWSMTALVSRRIGDGWAVGLYDEMWTYYFAIGTVVGNHSFELQAIGSPQEHGNRFTNQTIANWDKYGKDFNGNVARLNGDFFNYRRNKYNKPAINLNWNWQIGPKSTLSSIIYYSHGTGWGSSVTGSFNTITSGQYAGYRDFDQVFKKNSTTFDAKYSTSLSKASTIMYTSANNHDWSGILSTFKTELSPTLTLTAGIDGRYYIGEHYNEVYDLIGGDYYVDLYVNKTTGSGDVNTPTKLVKVGDKYSYYYEGHVRQLGGFGQLEYKSGRLSAYVNLSASQTGYQRQDFFNYTSSDPLQTSPWKNFFTYTAKAGANYNLTEDMNVFANGGYFVSPPLLKNTFYGYGSPLANEVVKGTTTEKVLNFEVGYQFNNSIFNVSINGFYTNWKDRAFVTSFTDPTTSIATTTTVLGASQLHTGVELEAWIKMMNGLKLHASGTMMTAKYQNDVNTRIATEGGVFISDQVSYVNDLYVYGFPQTQASVELEYSANLFSGINLFINPIFKLNANQYSYFNADGRKDPKDLTQSWQIPDYTMLDLNASISYLLSNSSLKKITLGFHVYNLLDKQDYIVDASDGTKHDDVTSYVYYGRPRWFNVSVGFNF